MKWIVLPLVAATFLGWSGFLDRLDVMTVASTELAQASEEAPRTTGQAAREVTTLPAVARLTTQQADAFNILSDALQISAQRVFRLNDSLATQSAGLEDIVQGISSIDDVLDCVGRRLDGLIGTSRKVPAGVSGVTSILSDVEKIQRNSIRHLKSINRKLTALGVAAEATDVPAPPRPHIPAIELPHEGAAGVDC
jgi:hypothetical protein